MEIHPNMADLIEEVSASNISSIAGVVARIVAVINNPEATAQELVEIIMTDPPLAANVLRLVNSAAFAPLRRISDIQQAVIFIGFETLKEIALNQKVAEIFRKPVSIEGYSRTALWKHSVALAIFAKMIYRREFVERGENAYAAGLLHDLGIIVHDQFRNARFNAALQTARTRHMPLWEAEHLEFGYDHAQLAAALAAAWRLPDTLRFGIAGHHEPHCAPPAFSRMADALYLANYCCQQAGIGFCDAPYENDLQVEACRQRLTIEADAVELIMQDVQHTIEEMTHKGLL